MNFKPFPNHNKSIIYPKILLLDIMDEKINSFIQQYELVKLPHESILFIGIDCIISKTDDSINLNYFTKVSPKRMETLSYTIIKKRLAYEDIAVIPCRFSPPDTSPYAVFVKIVNIKKFKIEKSENLTHYLLFLFDCFVKNLQSYLDNLNTECEYKDRQDAIDFIYEQYRNGN